MSDTPMTDDRVVYGTLSGDDSIGAPWVNALFARHLERELNTANERIKRLEEAGDAMAQDHNPFTFIDWTRARGLWIPLTTNETKFRSPSSE